MKQKKARFSNNYNLKLFFSALQFYRIDFTHEPLKLGSMCSPHLRNNCHLETAFNDNTTHIYSGVFSKIEDKGEQN